MKNKKATMSQQAVNGNLNNLKAGVVGKRNALSPLAADKRTALLPFSSSKNQENTCCIASCSDCCVGHLSLDNEKCQTCNIANVR